MHIRTLAKGRHKLVWEAGVDAHGKRLQRYETFRGTKADAEKRWREVQSELDRGNTVPAAALTLDELVNQWLEAVSVDLAPKTLTDYRLHYDRHIKDALGHIPLRRLTPSTIQRFYAQKLKTGRLDGRPGGLSTRTVAYLHAILHRALQQGVEWEMLSRNAASAVRAPKLVKKARTVWTSDQVAQFFRALEGHRLYAVFYLTFTTGMREGEVLGLTWDNIDLQTKQLRVVQSLTRADGQYQLKPPKTARSRRVVALDDRTVAVLRAHKAAQNQDKLFAGQEYESRGLVFATGLGRPLGPRNLLRDFQKACRAANVPVLTYHELRHTNATILFEHGVDAKIVSERLGHASVQITLDTYTHMRSDMQQRAVEAIEQAMGPKWGQTGKTGETGKK